MNLYNFILDRDKLLLPIKARNFTWFLRALRVCLAVALKRKVLFKDSGMASCLPFLKRECTKPDHLKTFIRGNHYAGRCSGMEGTGKEQEQEVRSGVWLWPPPTLSRLVEMYLRSIYKQIFFLPPPDSHRTSPGMASHTSAGAVGRLSACARGFVAGGSWVKHLSFPS
jgi:hypothetical protein